jgi:eukaryotic-like serine/threonine-protein kinase
MADPRFLRLRTLFDQALELDPADQEAFADHACAADTDLREELGRLLRRHRDKRTLTDRPVLPALDVALREALPEAFVEGRMVGPFRIIEIIGDGGMGRVYRATRDDGEVQQDVAIKLIRGQLMNPALLARFSVERRMLAALNHPNICRFLDAGGLSDGSPYVVMELVDGQPLYDYCDEHRLGLEQRLQLLRKVVAAVAHAHRQLIVHRDIKSSNVLVDRHGEPKLLDFGIAKSLDERDHQQTSTSDRFFTPANAAPEQLRGEPVGVGCDIYGLGLLAYGLLCGRPPFDFDALRAGEVERLLLDVPPPPMSRRVNMLEAHSARQRGLASSRALVAGLRGDLDAIVATCLRKAASERYRSAEQLDADLGAVLAGRPLRVRRGERFYRARKFVARHRLPVMLVAVLATTWVAGSVLVAWQAFSLAEQRDRVTHERDRAQQLVTLLKESFIGADPARFAGDSVRLGDVLDLARPRIESLHDSQPAVYASLAATLSEVDLALSRDSSAMDLASRGIEAIRRTGSDPALERTLLLTQAVAATRMGDHDSAVTLLDEVRRRDSAVEPDWMVAAGTSLGRRAMYDESVSLLTRAVATLAARPPVDHLSTSARHELIYALRLQESLDAALQESEATLAWQLGDLPPSHPNVVRTRLYRADILAALGNAEDAFHEASAIHASVVSAYGSQSAIAGRTGMSLATALRALGRDDEAIAQYRAAVEVWRATLGANHAQTIRATFNLAYTLKNQPEASNEALDLLRSATAGAASRFGEAADSTSYMRSTLASELLDAGQAREALFLLSSAPALAGLEQILHSNRDHHRNLLTRAIDAAGCGQVQRADEAGIAAACRAALPHAESPLPDPQSPRIFD